MVDVEIQGLPLANRAALTSVVALDSVGEMNVRAAKNHVTIYSKHQGLVIGDRPEHVRTRLAFRTPSAIEVFRALASAANRTVSMSDKGGFAQAVIDIWGGWRTWRRISRIRGKHPYSVTSWLIVETAMPQACCSAARVDAIFRSWMPPYCWETREMKLVPSSTTTQIWACFRAA